MTAPDRASTLELLYRVSRDIAAPLDLREALTRILSVTLENVGGERGTLLVLDEAGEVVESAIVYRQEARESNTGQLRETVDRGLAGWVVRNRRAALIPDTRRDERWLRRADDEATSSAGLASKWRR